ncbi:hypothetical protein V5O48_003786 [Marasmius crinis-equi]|uniref:Myb-like domain-containing protein n=1 Tax=Marasmius crinis-equi TaxID=585013 RepID=A0ABR3FRW6_9AGAR
MASSTIVPFVMNPEEPPSLLADLETIRRALAHPRRWTQSENEQLLQGVHSLGSAGTSWEEIARTYVPTRTARQCRRRWREVLDPSIDRSDWSAEEDKLILQILRSANFEGRIIEWNYISSIYFPGRTALKLNRRAHWLEREAHKGSHASETFNPHADNILADSAGIRRRGSNNDQLSGCGANPEIARSEEPSGSRNAAVAVGSEPFMASEGQYLAATGSSEPNFYSVGFPLNEQWYQGNYVNGNPAAATGASASGGLISPDQFAQYLASIDAQLVSQPFGGSDSDFPSNEYSNNLYTTVTTGDEWIEDLSSTAVNPRMDHSQDGGTFF